MPVAFKIILTLLFVFFGAMCPSWPFWETRWDLWNKVWAGFIITAVVALACLALVLIWS